MFFFVPVVSGGLNRFFFGGGWPTRGHRFLGLMFHLIIGGPNFDLHRSLHPYLTVS